MAEDREAPVAAGAPADEGRRPPLEAEGLPARVNEPSAPLEHLHGEGDLHPGQPERRGLPAAPAPAPPVVAEAPPGKVLVDQADYEQLRQAKRDLVRLLRRLGRPPIGWVLRRQKGYRRLRQRWLREG